LDLRFPTTCASVHRLELVDFRSYSALALDLHPGQNVIYGKNGQGKSNIVEALYLLASTRSFRGSKDKEMIRHGCESSRVGAVIGDNATEVSIEIRNGSPRRAFVNSQKLPRVVDIAARVPAVVFSSADLAMVDAGPAERRSFLDTEISLLSPSYLIAHTAYKRAVEQRNAALRAVRDGRSPQECLYPWEAAIAEKGSAVREARRQWIQRLLPAAEMEHSHLAGEKETLGIEPTHADESSDSAGLAELLSRRRLVDIASGHTSVGPHRDDFRIVLNGRDARSFASQGQRRTLALSLKLSVAKYWRDVMRVVPIVLLDDIMSDLDAERRQAVMRVSGKLGQVIITTTDVDSLRSEMSSDATFFEVSEGEVVAR
jgi:DNA replication and repair protein RecF